MNRSDLKSNSRINVLKKPNWNCCFRLDFTIHGSFIVIICFLNSLLISGIIYFLLNSALMEASGLNVTTVLSLESHCSHDFLAYDSAQTVLSYELFIDCDLSARITDGYINFCLSESSLSCIHKVFPTPLLILSRLFPATQLLLIQTWNLFFILLQHLSMMPQLRLSPDFLTHPFLVSCLLSSSS